MRRKFEELHIDVLPGTYPASPSERTSDVVAGVSSFVVGPVGLKTAGCGEEAEARSGARSDSEWTCMPVSRGFIGTGLLLWVYLIYCRVRDRPRNGAV